MKPDIITTRLFFDPLAVPLTILFSKVRWITANLVTFSALLPGLAGAYCFAMGYFGWGAAGYYVFFLLDTVDGKLARLLGKEDPLGAFYDFVVDRIVIGTMLLGMGWAFIHSNSMATFVATQLFLFSFFIKDVFDLKWKEAGVSSAGSGQQASGDPVLFARCKIHCKPGQLLSCFITFLIAPLTKAYVPCFYLATVCVLFSLGHNVLRPWFIHLRNRG